MQNQLKKLKNQNDFFCPFFMFLTLLLVFMPTYIIICSKFFCGAVDKNGMG